MLSQQLSKAALAMQLAPRDGELHVWAKELKTALDEWSETHRGLQQGDPGLVLPAGTVPRTVQRFPELEPHFQAMQSAARDLISAAEEAAGSAVDQRRIQRAVSRILDHEGPYLGRMNDIVSLYRVEAKAQVLRIQRTELVLVGSILVLLVLTGLFVLRPAARTMRRQVGQLMESEERFRVMADTAPVLIWMSGPDKACTYFNRGWLDFTGRTLEQEVGYGWAQGVHSEDLDRCIKTYEQAFEARLPFRMEYRLARHDGEHRWVLDTGAPRSDLDGTFAGYIGSCIDITERKRAEYALQQARDALEERVAERTANLVQANAQLQGEIAERRRVQHELVRQQETLRAILDNAPIGIWMVAAKGRLRFFNDTFREWFEVPGPSDPEGTDYAALFDAATTARWCAADARCLKGESPGQGRERVRFADGEWHDLEVIRAPLAETEGDLPGLVCLAVDLTERESAERAAKEHQAALAHVSRLSTMGEMASSIAHELNQPLAAICNYARGCVRRLEAGSGASEEVLDAMRRVAVQAERAGEIIRRIRNFLRKEPPRRVAVDVNHLVREVADLIAPAVRQHGVLLRLDLAQETPRVLADPIQLEQVVLNLAHNAIEAMLDDRRELTIETRANGDAVEVAVRDTGHGLEPDALGRVFDPFYSTKPGGMGMGLSISRSIVEAQDGRLWADADPSGGMIFRLRLPTPDWPSARR